MLGLLTLLSTVLLLPNVAFGSSKSGATKCLNEYPNLSYCSSSTKQTKIKEETDKFRNEEKQLMDDIRDKAISFMRHSQYDLAIPLFLELAQLDSDDYSVHYMLGQCYRFNGQHSEALESLIKSEQLLKDSTPDDMQGPIYLALGIAHQTMKEFDTAI